MAINIQPLVIQRDNERFKQEWQLAIQQNEAKPMETVQSVLNRITDMTNAKIRKATNDTYKNSKH